MPQEPSNAPRSAIDTLLSILDLEPLEDNLFRGRSPQDSWQRVFGGQVLGQALMAANLTVDRERLVHSLHGYFLLAGDPRQPIIYEVERIRDGGSFTTRRVVAIQHGHAIFSMAVSFHKEETGFSHQFAMPDVPDPDTLPTEEELRDRVPENMRRMWMMDRPVELRPVNLDRYALTGKAEQIQKIWFRTKGSLPDDKKLHQCALASASDFTLLHAALVQHGRPPFDPSLMMASLDHAVWFHRELRADEWMLYDVHSLVNTAGRGVLRGTLHDLDRRICGSVAQEMRLYPYESLPG
jgi:acyl-CoA thioesterase-2